ncbi:MAG TPA: hypothetical protein PKA88_32520, partial [Polyangiaceae bacterium]|nr:hypothetical protein [Polyangiaceae bacterium]
QAFLGIRMAVQREYGLTERGALLAVALSQEPDELMRAVPEGRMGASMLLALGRLVKEPDTRAKLLDAGIARDPRFPAVRYRRVEDLLRGLEGQTKECENTRVRCQRRATVLLDELESIEPVESRLMVARARLMIATNNAAGAETYLAEKCARLSAPLECRRWQIVAADKAQAEKLPSQGVAAFLQAACVNSRDCAAAANWLATVHMRRREFVAATDMYERAASELNSPSAWVKVAEAAEKAGLDTSAARARAKAEARGTSPD